VNNTVSETERRSAIMRQVKSLDTTPERTVRSMLHKLGFRYRLHRKDLPGKPDLVFPSRRKIVFVHGCFWHGHTCKRGARVPHTHREYWERKIAANSRRDAENLAQLEMAGWQPMVVWECELRDLPALQAKLTDFLM
jgi:DNA mismatch endonuclease (patch repair protein)